MRRMIAAGPPSKRPPHSGLAGASGGGAGRLSALLAPVWLAPVWLAPVLLATVVLLLLLGLPTLSVAADEDIKLGEFIPVAPPQPAPAVSFTKTDGMPVKLADFAGEATVVNLWATWCQPCLKEMPSLDRLQAAMAGKLRVVAISEDRGGAKLVNPFTAALKLKLSYYLDPDASVGHAFEVRGLPTSIVLDREGRVVGKVEGPAEWDSAKMKNILAPFVGGPAEQTHAFNRHGR